VRGRARSPVIDLPLKITLTPTPVECFRKNRRELKQLRMADSRLEYGIAVTTMAASSLQKMINIDYIAAVELARSEFSSKRVEIVDLTKLIVHRILFKKFENETLRMMMGSSLIKRWNRQNPTRLIDMSTPTNNTQVTSLLAAIAPEIPTVSMEIQEPILRAWAANASLSGEERTLRAYLSDGFILNASKLLLCVLARSRGQAEYSELIAEVRGVLGGYVEKAIISEYLSLMIVELLGYTEVSHYEQVARRLMRGRTPGTTLMTDEGIRSDVRRHMESEGDLLSLPYQIGSKGASIGTENRLRVTICNQEQGYQTVREQLESRIGTDVKERSLLDFYRKIPEQRINTELGLYYLSYLQKACEKQNVRIESTVSQVPRSDLTLINLTLQF